jgi:hypothetical protein
MESLKNEFESKVAYVRFSLLNGDTQVKNFIGYLKASDFQNYILDAFIFQKRTFNQDIPLKHIASYVCLSNEAIRLSKEVVQYMDSESDNVLNIRDKSLYLLVDSRIVTLELTPEHIFNLFQGAYLHRFEFYDKNTPYLKYDFYPSNFSLDTLSYTPNVKSLVFTVESPDHMYISEIPVSDIQTFLKSTERGYLPCNTTPRTMISCEFEVQTTLKEKERIHSCFSIHQWILMRIVYQYLFDQLKIQQLEHLELSLMSWESLI